MELRSFGLDLAASVDEAMHPLPVAPGFAPRGLERAQSPALPAWFIDRCRRAYLSVAFPQSSGRTLGITSARYGEGKTSVAVGTALAIAADTQEPTLLLECDMEHPSFAEQLKFSNTPGLSEWLEGSARLRVLRATPLENEFIIPAGGKPADPARVLYQLGESSLMADLAPHFRNVVLDLPPLLNIAYSSLACKLADRIVLVARYGVSQFDDVEKAIFLAGHERLAGIVLNGYASRVPGWIRKLL